MKVEVKFTDERARAQGLPYTQTLGSAGLDLRVYWPATTPLEQRLLRPGEQVLLDTGLSIWIDNPGYAGFMFARSGTGVKGLVLGNGTGVIDADYQGPLKVCLWNRSQHDIHIDDGDRVAQLVILPIASGYELQEVAEFSGVSGRGASGFGSTGVK